MSFEQTSNPQYSQFIALSRYARYRDDLGRREVWSETVDRWADYWKEKFPEHEDVIDNELKPAVHDLDDMPSMRSLMTAGEALDRCNVAGYNCSYLPIESLRDFDEMLYILMNGTGVGYSVERQYVSQLPTIAEEFHESDTTIVAKDSKLGWAKAFKELLSLLSQGEVPNWDMSKVRPAGSRLKTFGGQASGPEPLNNLFHFTVSLFKKAAGRKLSSLECHDLCCKIAEIVVVGGVRRSALISLSNLSDDRMRLAKSGQWWIDNAQRALANNSAAYTEKPEFEVFLKEWNSLYESKSGERGIFSRVAAQKQAGKNERREPNHEFGFNPCGEIILRPRQFCNLSEVVVRPNDTMEDLKRKVRVATIIGTFQSTLTNFRYLRKQWENNTKEERLLGVSMTGIMDHPFLNGSMGTGAWFDDGENKSLETVLKELQDYAVEVNKKWADKLGIEQSTAVTCVKPSGTVSQLVDSASGIHPRFSRYYLRTVRADKKDPLAHFMDDKGFYWEWDQMNNNNMVFYFPVEAPEGSITAKDISAYDQLNLWKTYRDNWCEHNPSMTCYYTDDDFLGVGQWVWDNFNKVSGISFLPYDDHVYPQAPYQPVDRETFDRWYETMPKNVDWTELANYEGDDYTEGSQEMACSSGSCEI